jgi:ornithine carbamoyltransferase
LPFNFKNKSFLSLKDFSEEELTYLLELSIKLKHDKISGVYNYNLKNKNIAMIFEKTSTRTRCATSVACFDEGANADFLGKDDIQMGKKESIKDTARVLGRMYDLIFFRGYKQDTVAKLAEFSGIPVINGLTDEEHPTQVIADLMTIKEVFGTLKNIKIAYIGDGRNNVSNSLLIGAAKLGIDISIGSPKNLFPEESLIKYCKSIAKQNNSTIIITDDPDLAVKDSDVIYTDVWVSMGEEHKSGIKERLQLLKPYQVNKKLFESTNKKNTIFLHCLPAAHEDEIHNMEVTDEVFESERSFVFQQAENRLHTIKAILIALIGR